MSLWEVAVLLSAAVHTCSVLAIVCSVTGLTYAYRTRNELGSVRARALRLQRRYTIAAMVLLLPMAVVILLRVIL